MTSPTRGLLIHVGRIAAVSAVALAPLGLMSAASAASAGFNDAAGDMLGHGADILRVRVTNDKMVRVRIKHDNLVRSFRSGSSGTVYFDTDRSKAGPEFAFVAGLYEDADYSLQRVREWDVVESLPLGGRYELRLDYGDDLTHIKIGRRALGSPDAVRVAVQTGGDLDNHTVEDWLRGSRKLTPWVARG
jgi:hypothetical protein